jgi:hypothetical protein
MPLPQPKPNELREDFVDRCVANIDMILEFPEADQRMAICYNLYEASRKAQATAAPKINKAEYIREANRQLKLAETEQYLKFYNYFKREYFKGADRFLQTRSLPETVDLFKESDIAKLYEDLYVEVGLRFLRWYQKNFQKFTQKEMDEPIYVDRFARRAKKVAGEKVTLVSGARKKDLQKFLKQQMSNPEFMAMNERQAQRVLRSKFSGYSKSQAERLIRTESNGAGNYASQEAAREMFDGTVYKEWITAKDARVRDAHAAMEGVDGQVVKIDEQFWVGGEYLDHPSDLANSGKPENVINCRCQAVYYPEDTLVDLDSMVSQGTALAAEAVAAKGPKVYDTTKRSEIEAIFKDEYGVAANLEGLDPKIARQYLNIYAQIKNDFPDMEMTTVYGQKGFKDQIKRNIKKAVRDNPQIAARYAQSQQDYIVTSIYNTTMKQFKLRGSDGASTNAFAFKGVKNNWDVGNVNLEIDHTNINGITHWNTKSFEVQEARKLRSYDVGWASGYGEGASHTIYHEFGHMIDYSKKNFYATKEFDALVSKYHYGGNTWNYTALEADLSEYAAHYGKKYRDFNSMKKEIIAEAVGEVYSMGDKARPLAKSIVEALKMYKKSIQIEITNDIDPDDYFIAPPQLNDKSDYF